ncbi:hypothetical protein LIER_27889 [Lithospermum erythrorhizon]|uniref:Retrotransposon gag domain-containing protein n=1 Tax=Lithospermum erythrorhizon TaxID=34254 RepID=A0AAV3RGM0_LITER
MCSGHGSPTGCYGSFTKTGGCPFRESCWTDLRETGSIAFFQERFQTEFNLIPRENQKIDMIAFVKGLRMCKFKESLIKRQPQDLEEVNERAYKYIRIEEAEKRDEKGKGKRPMEEHRWKSPKRRRRSSLDRIRHLKRLTHRPTF